MKILSLVLVLTGILSVSCFGNLGGDGGHAEIGFEIDESNPDRPVITPVLSDVPVGSEIFVRLQVPVPLNADVVRVRLEKRIGTTYRERMDFEWPVVPPWNVAIIPLVVTELGNWNVALIVNSRKVTDVKFKSSRS